jgi:hypothetical protein
MASNETIAQAEATRNLIVELPESLVKQVKIEAVHRDTTIRALVEQAIRAYLSVAA